MPSPAFSTPPAADPQLMACMEIWGGSAAVDTSVQIPGLDAWVYANPYKRSTFGGDVHYLSTCATGRITRLLLADVSGHGDEVAGVARILRDLMRQYVNFLDHTKFVRMMNRRFTALSASNIFATALVTTFFSPTRVFSLCNAGHPPPMLYRAASRSWSLLDTTPAEPRSRDPVNLPLGILEFADYDQLDVRLEVGDLVLLYTDSLIEAADSNGKMLGPVGILNILQSLPTNDGAFDPAGLIPRLLLAISSAHPNNLHDDDVTTLLIRANGTATKVSIKDKLLAPARVVKGIFASLFTGGKALPLPEMSVKNIGGAIINRLSQR